MSFLAPSKIDIQFKDQSENWRFYVTTETLLKAKRIEQMNQHEFVFAAEKKKSET